MPTGAYTAADVAAPAAQQGAYSAADIAAPAAPVGGDLRAPSADSAFMATYPVGQKGEGIVENAGNFAKDVIGGGYQLLAHPIRTGAAALSAITPQPLLDASRKAYEQAVGQQGGAPAPVDARVPNPIQSTYQGLNTRPAETIAPMIGQAAVTAGLAKGIPAAADMAGNLPNPMTAAKNALSGPPEIQITKALQPSKNNATWNSDVRTALPQIKATAQQMGNPITGFDDAAVATTQTLKNIWSQVDAFQKQTGRTGVTIDGNPIADAMMDSIDKRMAIQNPGLVDRIKAIADTYRRDIPVNEAEDFIQSNNKELTGYYAKNKVSQQAASADPEVAAKIAEGDALRDGLYSKINDISGPGVAQLKQAYGAVRNVQKNLVQQQMVYARKAPVSLGEQVNYFQAAGKALTGDLVGAAKDVAVQRFMSDLNDKNSMIQRAFEQTQPAQPFLMPKAMPRIAGQLPAQAGGPIELPYVPEMSSGERVAALMQALRRNPQLALPSRASAIPLPPPQ